MIKMTFVAGASLSLGIASAVLAQTKTWTGAVNADWNTPGNWTPAGVPTGSDDVLVGPGSTPISFATSNAVRSLDLRRVVDINESVVLTVQGGGITINGGELVVTAFNSAIHFVGGTQSISAAGQGGRIRMFGGARILAINCALSIASGAFVEHNGQDNYLTTSGSGTLTVLGTLEAKDGFGQLEIEGVLTNYNTNTKALTGGRWIIKGAGIFLPFGTDVDVIGANTTIVYAGANPNAGLGGAESLAANLGTIELADQRDVGFVAVGPAFQNAGTIKLGNGSYLFIDGNFRSLPGSVIDLTITGVDPNLQQSWIEAGFGRQAQLNNAGTLRLRLSNAVPFDCGQTFEVLKHGTRVGNFGTIETIPASNTVIPLYNVNTNTRVQVTGACQLQPRCDDVDFNNDGLEFDPTDLESFFSVYSGGPCL